MKYDFKTLSPADFEDLARDLLSAELGIRLEGFGPGPDGGIDGRHCGKGGSLILQAKHKASSTFSSLKSVMKKERKAIDHLKPERYVLATSQSLTPLQKSKLAEIIGSALKSTGDILGCTELNAMLAKHPSVEETHIKLWLSSTTVLKRLLRSAAFAYTSASRTEMIDKLRVFVPNPSFSEARKILEKHHVLIISGPPGVGKTTLAQMLAYAYVGEEWEFTALKDLDDDFSEIEDAKKQMFFFDDFLGKISLDRKALAAKDTILAHFIHRIQRSKNARFILTTRAYIFEEARSVSESIGDRRLDISKYVLDVGVYTRRVRARILYNHIVASSLSADYVRAFLVDGVLPKIVDHPHYNPRIIDWMTDQVRLIDINPATYADHFLHMLDHPTEIWDRAFREHIPPKARHLLISLFFLSESGEDVDDLRKSFEALHARLCTIYNLSSAPTDFQDALKLLEGSFVSIRSRQVGFVNPSVRDYLEEYLSDVNLLAHLAPTAQSARWAQELWQHYKSLKGHRSISSTSFVELFSDIAGRFKSLPVWRPSPHEPGVLRYSDLALTDRIKLLAEWRSISLTSVFDSALQGLIFDTSEKFSAWLDGSDLPDLVWEFRGGKWSSLQGGGEIADQLEGNLVKILEGAASSSALNRIRKSVECMEEEVVSERVMDALKSAIMFELGQTSLNIDDFDSETELEDHVERLEGLARWADIDASWAIRCVKAKIDELKEEGIEKEKVSFPLGKDHKSDSFDDKSLRNLFEGLLQGH